MMRKTKILCTLGPASDSVEVLKDMIRSGMNVARLNMAHGELEDHSGKMSRLRQAAAELQALVPVLMDIKGPEIRIGKLQEPYVVLEKDAQFILTTTPLLGDQSKVTVTYEDMPNVVKPGATVLIDDGLIELRVTSIEGKDMICKVVSGGNLKPRKGVNLPGVKTTLPGVTERDVRHILFGLEHQVDIIAVSFVRKAEDILEVKRILQVNQAEHVQVISKIENEEGVANLDDIIAVSDGIMVARGDLGVEIPIEEVPLVQREMIEKCNAAGKPVIVATHMLESMQSNPRPTRAEVSDVSTAVLQGADVVMLSGETAAGKYPIQSVAMMATIAEKAETTINYWERFAERKKQVSTNVTEMISQAAVSSSLELDAKAIITPTESGFTARMVSKYRPKAPILAITQHYHTLLRLCLLRGVVPVLGDRVTTTDEMFDSAIRNSGRTGLVRQGDHVVITAGVPMGKSGTSNVIKIQQL
jgi:pyruvate kinase